MQTKCWRGSPPPASTSMRLPASFRPTARSLSSAPGTSSWTSSHTRALRCSRQADGHDRQAGSDEAKGKPMTAITTELLPLTARPAWKALEAHYEKIRGLHLRTLFAEDAARGERMTTEGAG